MTDRRSLDAAYFEGIFTQDADPWSLTSSPYEAKKHARTCAALADRRYACALEVGCAHGVLTERLLPLCDRLLAIDISGAALERARARLRAAPGLELRRMAFPLEAPAAHLQDLVVLSEVAYYWSDADLALAADWLNAATSPDGRVILVHYTGQTDYPQTGDQAVEKLRAGLSADFRIRREERHPGYRLDLWGRG